MPGGLYSPTAGDVLTAANAIDYWSKQVVIIATSGARPTAREGMVIYETDTEAVCVYNGTAWVQITHEAATVATSETEANTAYDDMATSGPAVTITTNTLALVTVGAHNSSATGGAAGYMSYAVSGATTIAAADSGAFVYQAYANSAEGAGSKTSYLSGLTAGANVLTAKYKNARSAGTETFVYRHIAAVGLLV